MKETIEKIRKLIEKSDNPLFFYDDDPDGLISYLLLKKHYKKGIGVIIRRASDNETDLYQEKIKEYSPDLVLFLDKPELKQKVFNQIHVPVIWIDHHIPIKVKGVTYLNPRLKNAGNNKPTSYLCYQITKDNLWLAAVGVTSDWSLALYKDFKKKYPELVKGLKIRNVKPGDVLYKTELGRLAKIFSFILKGKTSDVRKDINFISKINDPYDILEKKTEEGKFLFEKAEKLTKLYDLLLEQAKKEGKKSGRILFFRYSEDKKFSFTSNLANELIYIFPNKIVMVAREKEGKVKSSLRSSEKDIKLPRIINKIFRDIPGNGGGHEHACAALFDSKYLESFMELLEKNVKK